MNLLVFFLVETTASVTPVERLRGALPVWRELGAPRSILRLIEHGLTVPWQHGPPPSWPILREYPLSPEQRVWWEVEEQRLIALGAIRHAAPHECSHMCPAFCVPKDRPGVFRLVIDERPLNRYVQKRVFKMDVLKDFLACTASSEPAIRVDIADAYYHIGISLEWQRFFGFCINGRSYVLTAAAMGYTLSPWLFTALMRVPLRFLRTGGTPPRSPGFPPTPAMAWLDDLLCLVQSSQHAAHLRLFFLSLGFCLHDRKCVWEPQRQLEYLGFNLDLVRGRVSARGSRLDRAPDPR